MIGIHVNRSTFFLLLFLFILHKSIFFTQIIELDPLAQIHSNENVQIQEPREQNIIKNILDKADVKMCKAH